MSNSYLQSLTTGEIAKYCGVNLRTVIRWLEAGKLKGYKLPGRGNNRVLVSEFVAFLKQHDMPVPKELEAENEPLLLIVDDELSMAKAIQRVARKVGLKSIVATGGFQAGLMLSMHKPQMMTLDLSMPGLNGFDVLKYTRSQNEFADLHIVVISALDSEKLEHAKNSGANTTFSKPFNHLELMVEFQSITK